MKDHRTTWIDSPAIAADFLARSGLIDSAFAEIAERARGLAKATAEWLSDSVVSGHSGRCPVHDPGEQALFTGIVVFSHSQPTCWLLVRTMDVAPGPNAVEHFDRFPGDLSSRHEPVASAAPRWRADQWE